MGSFARVGQQGTLAYVWARLAKGSVRRSWMEWQDEGYLELADLDADEFNPGLSGTWTRGLLIRRNIGDRSLAYFTTWCTAGMCSTRCEHGCSV